MANVIIIAVLVIAAALGIRSAITHFKGDGVCCGGGGELKPLKKKLPKVLFTRQFHVEGMHCEHCKNRVESAVNDIDNVAGKVNLKKATLTVSYAADVPNETILQAVEKAGYTAAAI